jgi:serine/threonine kinase 16
MCYFKSPFDAVYERGDSVALAVISGNITFPESSPYDPVSFMLQLYSLFELSFSVQLGF